MVEVTRRKDIVLGLILALLFVLLGHLIVLQRSFKGTSPWFQMSPDARQYIAMVQGEKAWIPFSHRILVPFLAARIPLPPDQALRAISYASLLATYWISYLVLGLLGIEPKIRVVSLISLFTCTADLLMYQNPFLTDAFSLMSLTAMLYFLLRNRAGYYGAISVLGILGRESCLAGAPAFFATKRWRASLLICLVSSATYLAPRFHATGRSFGKFNPSVLFQWTYFARAYFLVFGFLWIPVLLGLILCAAKRYTGVLAFLFFLFFGALYSSLMAGDTDRMYLILTPAAVALWACYFQEIARHRVVFFALLVLVCANVFLALPTVFLVRHALEVNSLYEWYVRLKWPLATHQFVGLLLALFSAYCLRDRLTAAMREKAQRLRDLVARRPSLHISA